MPGPARTYTEEDCIQALREVARRIGEPPSKRQYQELGRSPSMRTICKRFGGWNSAKEAAGLGVVKPKHERLPSFYTDELGYERIATKVDGDQKSFFVHRLVAVAEYGFDEVIEKQVHHMDRVSWDNRSENLEPLTSSEHRKAHAEAIH